MSYSKLKNITCLVFALYFAIFNTGLVHFFDFCLCQPITLSSNSKEKESDVTCCDCECCGHYINFATHTNEKATFKSTCTGCKVISSFYISVTEEKSYLDLKYTKLYAYTQDYYNYAIRPILFDRNKIEARHILYMNGRYKIKMYQSFLC